jgi:hypothetical protein
VTRQPQSIECVYEVEVRVAVLVTGLGMQGEDDVDRARDALALSRAWSPRAWHVLAWCWACWCWPMPWLGELWLGTGVVLVCRGSSVTW